MLKTLFRETIFWTSKQTARDRRARMLKIKKKVPRRLAVKASLQAQEAWKMGLGIEAETPEEIAVNILAEILVLRGNGSGKSMKEPH